jgi:hypothetical protein
MVGKSLAHNPLSYLGRNIEVDPTLVSPSMAGLEIPKLNGDINGKIIEPRRKLNFEVK